MHAPRAATQPAHLRQIETYGFRAGLESGETGHEPLSSSLSVLADRVGRYALTRVPALNDSCTPRSLISSDW